jgi:hypothetical protein
MSGLVGGGPAVAARVFRDRQTAGVIGLLVFSHRLLDYLEHASDLPLEFDRSPRVGLGLEYSLEGEAHWTRALMVEVGVLAAGIAAYRRGAHDHARGSGVRPGSVHPSGAQPPGVPRRLRAGGDRHTAVGV